MGLKEELTEIHGIGDAKAAEIMDVVAAHEGALSDEDMANVRQAYEHIDVGHYQQAGKFLRRVLDE